MTPEHESPGASPADARADWNKPKPDVIPRLTYAPVAMAFGLTLFFWGLVTSPVLLGAGLLVVALSLVSWVREMRHE